MAEPTLKPEDHMMQWITSKWINKPIHVAVELGIVDLLRDKPMTVKALAYETDTHAPTLYRLLRALSTVGIFIENDDQMFELTPLGQCLCSDAMAPLALMFLSDWHEKAWSNLNYSVKSGNPAFEHAFNKKAFDWTENEPEARTVFDQAQGVKAMGLGKAVINTYDFSNINSVCDVGGGQGSFMKEILKAYPHLQGIVSDLPGVMPSAQKTILESNLQDRFSATPCDFFKDAPPAGDIYCLVNVLHDWEDDACSLILKNIVKGMTKDSRLLILEYIVEPGPEFSVAKLLDLEVLVMGGGRERTLEEYKTLLSSNSIEIAEILPADGGVTVLECKVTC